MQLLDLLYQNVLDAKFSGVNFNTSRWQAYLKIGSGKNLHSVIVELMFGPFTVKDGCKEKKRYGALFTCLSSRAVHIEVSHSMTTDSFIMCLRRFIGRRGYVRVIRTDNGTNFVGASAELIESFQEMNHLKIGEFFQQHGGEWIWWKRNPH